MSETDELQGQVALITGAGRGIGLATARELARRGAGLVLLDRQVGEEATALLAEVESTGRVALADRIDLTDHAAAQPLLHALVGRVPQIDVLVNNAGWLRTQPFLEITVTDWQQHLDTNLTSMFMVTQAVLPGMLRRGTGRIVNISSELALTGMIDYVAYSASKAGVVGLTKALAREVAPAGIRVNSVAPGPTVTAMLTEMTGEFNEATRQAIPARRFGVVEDIALAVAFLAGPGGDFFVGQVLSPNGGVVI